MITTKEVQHIANLARLGLTPKEIEKFRKELSSILDYVEQLKQVNVEGIEPTFHALKIENVFRQDEPKKPDFEKTKKLIKAFPKKEKGFLKVKKVF